MYSKKVVINKAEGNTSKELGLKNLEETKNYFITGKNQNNLMSNNSKKFSIMLSSIEHVFLELLWLLEASHFLLLLLYLVFL